MTRWIWMLSLFLMTVFVHAAAADPDVRDPHIRSTERDLLDDLAIGAQVSPTLQHLIDRLAASNVVVYLMFDRSIAPYTDGHISLLATVPGRRYLRIAIDRRIGGCRRLAILGHELQHAVEIADAPAATDQDSVAALYTAIGFRSCSGRDRCFDSRLAIETGQRIWREALGHASSVGSR
jgi:hypothetical protein